MIDTEGMTFAVIKWLDAADRNDIKIKDITTTKDLLVERTSYGRLGLIDENGYVLIHDVATADKECEITTIPKDWVTNIKVHTMDGGVYL